MDLQLTGKRALVTGGSRGIGLRIARALLAEGAHVAIAARDAERLAKAAAELGTSGHPGRIVTVRADTGDDESVRAAVREARDRLGGIDILVNNAAVPGGLQGGPAGPSQTTDQQFTDAVNVKVLGYLRTVRAVVPDMITQGWGADHQHLRPGRPQQRQLRRDRPQHRRGRADQEPRRRARLSTASTSRSCTPASPSPSGPRS
nr:hypothetical protein GCM10020092_073590 [Actinoplanes digitatis]